MLRNKKFLIGLFLLPWVCSSAFCQSEVEPAGNADNHIYDAKGKRNPFIPLVTPEGRLLRLDKEVAASADGLLIEGIIYDKFGRSFAIVNTLVVGIGDMVGDYQVLKIQEDKVIFIKDGVPFEVELNKKEEE